MKTRQTDPIMAEVLAIRGKSLRARRAIPTSPTSGSIIADAPAEDAIMLDILSKLGLAFNPFEPAASVANYSIANSIAVTAMSVKPGDSGNLTPAPLIRQMERRSERLDPPPALCRQRPPQADAAVGCRRSSEFDAGFPEGSVDGLALRGLRRMDSRGDVRIRRAGTKTPHVARARETAAALAPRSDHGEGVGSQHLLPHFRCVGVFRAVVRRLEDGRPAGRPFPAIENTQPTSPGEIRTKQDGEVPRIDPERDGDFVGRQRRNTLFGLPSGRRQRPDGLQEILEDRVVRRERPYLARLPDKDAAVGDGVRRSRPGPREPRKHSMELPDTGASDGEMAAFQRIDGGEELRAAQRAGAAERGVATGFEEFRHASYVVVVPVRRDDQVDGAIRIEVEAFQIIQCARRSVDAETGIDGHPNAAADVQDDAFTVAGSEEGDFELVVARRPIGHGASARAMSSAHARAFRRSDSVITGRSRNTICDTRFLVPATERS